MSGHFELGEIIKNHRESDVGKERRFILVVPVFLFCYIIDLPCKLCDIWGLILLSLFSCVVIHTVPKQCSLLLIHSAGEMLKFTFFLMLCNLIKHRRYMHIL